MKKFINMDFDGTKWWVEYTEDGIDKKDLFDTKSEAIIFYETFFSCKKIIVWKPIKYIVKLT